MVASPCTEAEGGLLLDAVDYLLPPDRIAQSPTAERDQARLMVLDRRSADTAPVDATVRDLPQWLRAGDLLVVNATRVLPARLRGNKSTGGAAEALILGAIPTRSGETEDDGRYHALLRTGGRLRPGLRFVFRSEEDEGELGAELVALGERGEAVLAFAPGSSPYSIGEVPLPPYIERGSETSSLQQLRKLDRERYQTVYARVPGAVAAPTAGLHLTDALLTSLEADGVERAEIVLHVGPGTFRPPDPAELAAGRLHAEQYVLPQATAAAVARTRRRGGRVIAVGTTTTRVLETRAREDGTVAAGGGATRLLLRPGSRFRAVDGLLTNFHLPRSSLLLLVAAFAGRDRVLACYAEAIRRDYRFYSYGDAMLVL